MTKQMHTPSKWGKQQAVTILREAKARYGGAWHLMSRDQQANYVEARVLNLVLSQHEEKYSPAKALIVDVLSVLRAGDE